MDKEALRTGIHVYAFYSQCFHQPPKPSTLIINIKFWYKLRDFEPNTTNHSVTRYCCYEIFTIIHANPSPYGSKGITHLPWNPNSKERKSFCQAPRKLEFPETFSSHSPQKADFFFFRKMKVNKAHWYSYHLLSSSLVSSHRVNKCWLSKFTLFTDKESHLKK